MDRYVLIVSAGTDFIITAGGSVLSAMVATNMLAMPSAPVILVAVLTGCIAAARTVQQAIRKGIGQ